jgi:hypothetical protein
MPGRYPDVPGAVARGQGVAVGEGRVGIGWRRALARLALAAALFLATAEVAVRWIMPTPRVQVIRADQVASIEEVDGVPVWHLSSPEVARDGCANAPEGAKRAVFVGSSILRGSGVEGPQVFSELLRARLPAGSWCVENLAEPAFTAPQKAVVALRALARTRPPDLLVWEVWENDPGQWRWLGDRAVNLRHHVVDPATGAPEWRVVRGAWADRLFRASELWRYAVLTLATHDPDMAALMSASLERDLAPVVARAREVGTDVQLAIFPDLSRSFAASASKPLPAYKPVWPFAEAHGLTWLRVDLALQDQDVAALRLDTCCHYNAAGHEALADLFARRWFFDAPR